MRPIFTIHAGEFLVADFIERNYTKQHHLRVWVPSKDDGIDLLITSKDCKKVVSVQVKFSKSFDCDREYDASGWWKLNKAKIMSSPADFWVFVLPKSFGKRTYNDCLYFVIRPQELLKRMSRIHGVKMSSYNMYLTVKGKIAIESRELRKRDEDELFTCPKGWRDFSSFLNHWNDLIERVAQ